MKRMAMFIIAAVSSLVAGCGPDSIDLEGVVIGSEPIAQAQVQVWKLGHGGRQTFELIVAGETDDQGRFTLPVDLDELPVLVTASGGTTFEYWAPEGYELHGRNEDPVHHYEAVLTRYRMGKPGRPFVVSPLTTVIKALADQRYALGMDARYLDSMREARALLDEHFDFDSGATLPERKPNASMTPDVLHALALVGLSDVARDIAERSGYSVLAMNTWSITDALARDARGPGALLDGIGPGGEVITFDTCAPPCELSVDTLRTELARYLAAGFLRSPQNDTGLDYGDVGEWLEHLMDSAAPELFPGPAEGQLDDGAPMIQMLSSPMADERFDSITFDVNAAPIHDHNAVTTDLAQGFGGSDCPEVYKHVNLMWDPEDNPIRLRFAVLDDGVGASEDGIRVLVRPEGALQSFAVPVAATGWAAGGMEFEATITRADVPRLADTEGRFLVEIQVTDWLGHEATPLRGCFDNRPLSAQPWVGQARVATGPDSLQSVGLEPENNLAPLLNGVGVGQGKAVMEFEVRNGTDDPIYLTLDYAQPAATYRKSWIETYTELYTSTTRDDTCLISPATCPTSFPPEAVSSSFLDMPGLIANFIGGVRLWDISGELPREVLPCDGCDVTEYRLEPRRASGEPRRYRVALVVTALPELTPKLDSEVPGFYSDVALHPLHEPTEITGVLLDGFRVCWDPRGTSCWEQKVYQIYRALIETSITVTNFEVVGRLSPTAIMEPVHPFPQPGTFGDPLRIADLGWTASEGPLPGP